MTIMKVRPIRELDVPTAELERQLAEIRIHAEQHLSERGERPTAKHLDQWHEFLDSAPTCCKGI